MNQWYGLEIVGLILIRLGTFLIIEKVQLLLNV